MSDKALADVICRALLAIVAAIRKKYGLRDYHGISIVIQERAEDMPLPVSYNDERAGVLPNG